MSEKVWNPKFKEWVTLNHPHEIISPHVMRFAEIRDWLRELSTNPEYGWTHGGLSGLARALGLKSPNHIRVKIAYRWIWPKEQVRLTARINDILEGRVVPRRFIGTSRVDGVHVDPPQPPKVSTRTRRIALSVRPGGFTFEATDQKAGPKLPAFKRAFVDALPWRL